LKKPLPFASVNRRKRRSRSLTPKRLTREALQDVRQSVGALRLSGEVFLLAVALTDLVKNMNNGPLAISLEMAGDETNFQNLR